MPVAVPALKVLSYFARIAGFADNTVPAY